MAITVTRERRSVIGNKRLVTYSLTVGVSGDTKDCKLKQVDSVSTSNPAGITATTASGGTLTFTGTGAAFVQVIGL
jgi:hypothetical protein